MTLQEIDKLAKKAQRLMKTNVFFAAFGHEYFTALIEANKLLKAKERK